MDINLTGDELETAITEYLIARGVKDNATFEIRVIGGRAGNKSTASIKVSYEREGPITQVSKTYAQPEPLDHDPYEEEEETPTETASEPPEIPFEKQPPATVEVSEYDQAAEILNTEEEEPETQEAPSETTPMKSLFR